MVTSLLFAALAAFNLTVLPAEGRFVVFDDHPDGYTLIDASRIERDGDVARVPVIAITGPAANVGRAFAVYPHEVNCKTRQLRMPRFAIFNEDLSYALEQDAQVPDWQPLKPDAPIAEVFAFVCDGKPLPAGDRDLRALSQTYWRTHNVAAQ